MAHVDQAGILKKVLRGALMFNPMLLSRRHSKYRVGHFSCDPSAVSRFLTLVGAAFSVYHFSSRMSVILCCSFQS